METRDMSRHIEELNWVWDARTRRVRLRLVPLAMIWIVEGLVDWARGEIKNISRTEF